MRRSTSESRWTDQLESLLGAAAQVQIDLEGGVADLVLVGALADGLLELDQAMRRGDEEAPTQWQLTRR